LLFMQAVPRSAPKDAVSSIQDTAPDSTSSTPTC
jgi:hypothetical protein